MNLREMLGMTKTAEETNQFSAAFFFFFITAILDKCTAVQILTSITFLYDCEYCHGKGAFIPKTHDHDKNNYSYILLRICTFKRS